ncbi:MAG: tetratricopeptide repeat protein, partial [Cyclobacteriaceae bacterium]
WDKVLKIERPADSLLYMKGAWHYVRGIAMLRKGNVDEAGRELEALRAAVAMPEMEKLTIAGFNSFAQVLGIGRDLLEGEILAHDKRYEESVLKLRQAVASEDELLYQEPPDWFLPSRQVLGSVLLKAGKPAEAEEAFRNDLGVYRDNGWSLLGLAQSLEAQGKKMEANAVRNAFRKSFAQADIKPPGAVF